MAVTVRVLVRRTVGFNGGEGERVGRRAQAPIVVTILGMVKRVAGGDGGDGGGSGEGGFRK